jgi:integrase
MGLFKRDTVWWMRFTYKGRQFKKSTETKNKRIAEKIHHKVMAQIAEGKWFDRLEGEDKTIGDLLDKYIVEHAIPNKAPSTVRSDRGLAREMKKFFGDTPLSDVTPRLLTEYRSMCRGKGLAPSSINQRRTLLRHAFKLAIREWEWVKDNPVDRVGREKVNNARDRWLTIDQENRLIESSVAYLACRGNDKIPTYWLQEIVVFALNTGMRQDEILSLVGSHVDLFRRTVTVVRSKNGEKRTIPLSIRAFELLKVKVKGMDSSSGFVFASEARTKIDHRNLRRAFYEALKRAEIDNFRFHDLRHTFATRLAQAGVDLYKIAKLLGHKDIKMTQRYSHHYPESLRDGVAVLDKISPILAQSSS